MKNKIIIGLVGKIACGKGTVAKYLIQKYGAKGYKFSHVLRNLLDTLHIEASRKNLQDLSKVLRDYFGDNVLAKAMNKDIMNDNGKLLVVDGIRRMQDIKFLKDLPGFYLISVDANPEIRFERLKSRNENIGDNKKTWRQFLADHKKNADVQIPSVMKRADYKIDNSGDLNQLLKQVDEIIKKIKK